MVSAYAFEKSILSSCFTYVKKPCFLFYEEQKFYDEYSVYGLCTVRYIISVWHSAELS